MPVRYIILYVIVFCAYLPGSPASPWFGFIVYRFEFDAVEIKVEVEVKV